MITIDPITYEDLILSPISFEMTSSQESLPLFPSEYAYELLMPLLSASRIPGTRDQVTALRLRICFVLESCSTVSRLEIRDRVETTLKSYSAFKAPDGSHAQNEYYNGTESMDLACVLAGLVHHSGAGAVNTPLPRRAPGKAAVANLRSKLDAYAAWKQMSSVSPAPRSTHPRPSSIAGFLKATNTLQRPHSVYGCNKTQRHSYATLTSPNPRLGFVRSPSPKCSPTRWLSGSPHLSTIKEPEDDHPNGKPVSFPAWSPYRSLDKTVGVMMTRTTYRREKDPLTLSQVNPFTASPPT